jgi:hypothetical protein
MSARPSALLAATVVVACSVPTALANLPGGARYAGSATGGRPVLMRLSPNGQSVTSLRIKYAAYCDDFSPPRKTVTYTQIMNIPLQASGAFKASGTYKGSVDQSTNKFTVAGTVSARKARGTFSLTGTSPRSDGAVTRCKTGAVHWHAARAH